MDRKGNCSFLLFPLWYHVTLKTMCTVHRKERELKQYIIDFFFFFIILEFGLRSPNLRKMTINCVDILKVVFRCILSARLTRKWGNSIWDLYPTTHLNLIPERGLEVNQGILWKWLDWEGALIPAPPRDGSKEGHEFLENQNCILGILRCMEPGDWHLIVTWQSQKVRDRLTACAEDLSILHLVEISLGWVNVTAGELSWGGPALEDCLLDEVSATERLGGDAGEGA